MAALFPVELSMAIEALVADLAAGRFSELEKSGRSGRLTANHLKQGLEDYGRTFVPLPSGWQEHAWRYDVRATHIIAVDVDLWTVEEGRSDLTLQIEAWQAGAGWELAVTNLRVM